MIQKTFVFTETIFPRIREKKVISTVVIRGAVIVRGKIEGGKKSGSTASLIHLYV